MHAQNPLTPDPTIGRIFERTIRSRGIVYLTASEYEPYRWLVATMVVCGASVILVRLIGYVQDLVQRRMTK
jgi:hypothetical protein